MIKPTDIFQGTIDMSLRDLLQHMADRKLNHVILIADPGVPLRITVTIGSPSVTRKITKAIANILRG
jgi:hypothetical protein